MLLFRMPLLFVLTKILGLRPFPWPSVYAYTLFYVIISGFPMVLCDEKKSLKRSLEGNSSMLHHKKKKKQEREKDGRRR